MGDIIEGGQVVFGGFVYGKHFLGFLQWSSGLGFDSGCHCCAGVSTVVVVVFFVLVSTYHKMMNILGNPDKTIVGCHRLRF